MFAADRTPIPDIRFVERLDGLVRKTSSPRAFAAAGRVLAGVLAQREQRVVPTWAERLADAMIGSLWLVQARTIDESDATFRVELAAAAATLAALRPSRKGACNGAARVWMGIGMADPAESTDPTTLAQRALLALLVDDVPQAERCVAQLGAVELGGAGGVLHDWVIARRQRHGALREAECLHHLRLALSDAPATSRQVILVLASIVAREREGAQRRFAAWLEEVAPDGLPDPRIQVAV